MKQSNFTTACVVATLCMALGACDKANTPSVTGADASQKKQAQQQNTPPIDPEGVNAAIPAADFHLALVAQQGDLQTSADGKFRVLKISVTNAGKQPIKGAGKFPVNLGVQILGNDGTVTGPGAVVDFVRAALPLIQPGATAEVDVNIPANDARTKERKLRVAAVQEGVHWYTDAGDSPIVIGPL